MSHNTDPTHRQITKRKRHNIAAYAALVIAIIGYIAGSLLQYHLAGLLIYWTGFLAMVAIWRFSPATFRDERDLTIERKASDYTLIVFGLVLVFGGPGGISLQEMGHITLPTWFDGAFWTLVTIYVAYFIIYTTLRIRS